MYHLYPARLYKVYEYNVYIYIYICTFNIKNIEQNSQKQRIENRRSENIYLCTLNI